MALYGQSTNEQIPRCLILEGRLKTILECPWATKGQWKVFPEGKLAPTDPPPTAETCLQTICLVAGQLTVYTDDSATAGAKDGGA